MNRIGLLLAALAVPLLLAVPATAGEKYADDCTLSERDAPTLDRAKLPDARFRMAESEIGFERRENGEKVTLKRRHGQETATLASGVKLSVTQGGCENYSNHYVFVVIGDRTRLSDTRHWLTRASALIAEVAPANRDGFVRLPQLSRVLAREAATSRVDLTDGLEGQLDESHRYVATVTRRGERTLLRVSYIIRL